MLLVDCMLGTQAASELVLGLFEALLLQLPEWLLGVVLVAGLLLAPSLLRKIRLHETVTQTE